MPEGQDKELKSLKQLTGLSGSVFGEPDQQEIVDLTDPSNAGGLAVEPVTKTVAKPRIPKVSKAADDVKTFIDQQKSGPELPKEYYTKEAQEAAAGKAFQQQVNSALRYRSELEQQARDYYGNVPVSQSEVEGYMKFLHDDNVAQKKEKDAAEESAFMKEYGDPRYRNAIFNVPQFQKQIEATRLLKSQEGVATDGGRTEMDWSGARHYSAADTKRLDARGSGLADTAPVDMDEALDKDNNIRPEFARQLLDAAGGSQKKAAQYFADYMNGKRNQWADKANGTVGQMEEQQFMNRLHDQSNPLYYAERGKQGVTSGLHSVGNFLVNIVGGGYAEAASRAFGDGTINAANNLVKAQENFNKIAPSTTATGESHDWYNLDHIMSSGAHMAGEFAPSLMSGGEGMFTKLESSLAKAGMKEGLAGAAARWGATSAKTLGDSFTGRLMQNTLHMTKTAFPQVYAGYVEDGIAKGYTPDQAAARAFQRTAINMVALSVPGAVARGGIGMGQIPGKILSSATEQTAMRQMMGTAGKFVQAPAAGAASFAAGSLVDSYQNFLEDKRQFAEGDITNATSKQIENYNKSIASGELPQETSLADYLASPLNGFDYKAAMKDAGEQAAFGMIWGVMEKAVHGHGVLPSPVQADYIHQAVSDMPAFIKAVDKNVARGRMAPEQAEAMKSFVGRVAPVATEAVNQGMDPRAASQYAVEGERLKETAKAITDLNNQGKVMVEVDADGKKHDVLYGLDPKTNTYTEAQGKILTEQVNDLNTKAGQSARAIKQLEEGTYLKNRMVSGVEMVKIAGRYSPGDGLRSGQAKEIIDNGPYKTETVPVEQFRADPEIRAMAVSMLIKDANPEMNLPKAETQTVTGELVTFKPQNTNPVIVDADGKIIDGKKRIAYALANGGTEIEVARPIGMKELSTQVADEHQQEPDAKPATEGLTPEQTTILESGRKAFELELSRKRKPNNAEKSAGVTTKESRAYYAAAVHFMDQGLDKAQTVDMLRRVAGGTISEPQAEAFVNHIAKLQEAGKDVPVVPNKPEPKPRAAKPVEKAPVPSETTSDPKLSQSPFWDAETDTFKEGYGPGEAGFEEAMAWLDELQAGETPAIVPTIDPEPIATTPKEKVEQLTHGEQLTQAENAQDVAAREVSRKESALTKLNIQAAKNAEELQGAMFGAKDQNLFGADQIADKSVLEAARNELAQARKALAEAETNLENVRASNPWQTKMFEAKRELAKSTFTTADGNYHVTRGITGLEVVNTKSGKPAVGRYRSAAIREAAENHDFTDGYSAIRYVTPETEINSEADFAEHVLAHSSVPAEIAAAWQMQEAERPALSHIEQVIADNLGMITTESFYRHGDRNSLKGATQTIKAYMRNEESNTVVPLDVRAEELSSIAGREISPQDVIDFINRFPNGASSAMRAVEGDMSMELGTKFEKLTGFPLTKEIADIALSQDASKLSATEQAIIKKDYEQYSEQQSDIDAAVAAGEIKHFPEGGVSDVPEVQGRVPGNEAQAGQQLGGDTGSQPSNDQSAAGVINHRLGRAIISTTPEILAQSGWTQKSIKALHAQMLDMFGTDKSGREISLAVVDNESASEYFKAQGYDFPDPALAPDAWVSADKKTVYINAEKAHPSTALHELSHVWTSWAETKAPEIFAVGDKLARNSEEFKYASALLRGESPAMPEGMTAEDASRWGAYVDAYRNHTNPEASLVDEVLAHAVQNNGKMLAATEDEGRSINDKGKVVKGTWGKWLDSLWKAVAKAAGFRNITPRDASRLTLDQFAKAVAEEIGRGTRLSRKFKEAVDADVKNERKSKDLKKAEVIDESLAAQVDDAARKPKIIAAEDGESASIESSGSAAAVAAISNISPADVFSHVEAKEPEMISGMLEDVVNTTHYQRLADIKDPVQRAESALLDIIADPTLLATKEDKALMGGFMRSGPRASEKISGKIAGIFETLAKMVDQVVPESGVTATSIARLMAKNTKSQREELGLSEWDKVQPAPVAKATPANKISESRLKAKQEIDDLFSLPNKGQDESLFSIPATDPALEDKRHNAVRRFVETSMDDGSYKFTDVLNDAHSLWGDKLDTMYPYLKTAYLAHQATAEDAVLDMMDDTRAVRNFDYETFKTSLNASDTEQGLEPDSPRADIANGMGQADVQPKDGSGPLGRVGFGGEKVGGSGSEQPPRENIVSGDAPVVDGERGDRELPGGESRNEQLPAGDAIRSDAGGSGWYSHEGQRPFGERSQPTPIFAEARGDGSARDAKLKSQEEAEKIPVVIGDAKNIAETLPYLMPSQHEDVAFAEARLNKDDGYGVLFANGTGTGKTFTALGAVKRMVKAGKGEGIIVVPNEEVMREWEDSAPELGLTITRLNGTTDPGSGISITTFANFGQNDAIAKRNHDFVIVDEAHNLMSSGQADQTGYLRALRAITLHPQGVDELTERQNRELVDELAANRAASIGVPEGSAEYERLEKEGELLQATWKQKLADNKRLVASSQGAARPRAMFLSATPFAYRENIQWGEGYLYDYPASPENRGYNVPDGYGQFMIQHFGYRMRYGKLTQPESGVDSDYMERAFNDHLHKQGALSTRSLNLDSDYQRTFALTPNAVGTKIDDGLKFLQEANDGYFRPLAEIVNKRFDYLHRAQLLNAIKAKEAIPIIKKLLARGKQVVVYHDYNVGGGFSPFRFDDVNIEGAVTVNDGKGGFRSMPVQQMVREFHAQRPDLAELDFSDLGTPIQTLQAAFPHAGIINGKEKKADRSVAIKDFNDDSKPDKNLLIVNSAVNAGWSGHDKTGKHERVLINLGLPTAPTRAIQQEGRIYRVGQHPESNSHFIYLNTGTNWERNAYASKIAERASTAENLAMGNKARGLKRAFIDAFEGSDFYTPGPEDGRGSRDSDKRDMSGDNEWDKAKSLYYANQKKNSKNKAQEGTDYFATPEPLGMKVVEWAGIKTGEHVLEPSAGHGAIARWIPERTDKTIIEPSTELLSKANLNAPDARSIQDTFENHYIGNKYNAIVMNPPFGTAGKTASDHVEKAVGHLREGGRVVAIVPTGSFNQKFDKWFYGQDAKGKQLHPDMHLVARILLPGSTFERAGTGVNTQVLIIDRAAEEGTQSVQPTRDIDLTHIGSVKELFDALEHLSMPDRPKMATKPEASPLAELTSGNRAAQLPVAEAPQGPLKETQKIVHTKTGRDLFIVSPTSFMERSEYDRLNALAKENGGYYSKKFGTSPAGFAFPTTEAADAFRKAVTPPKEDVFSLPKVVNETRNDIDTGEDQGKKLESVQDELMVDGETDPNALVARGDLFAFPFSKAKRADELLDTHAKYFVKEDDMLGNRDIATVHAANMARKFQEEIQKSVGEKPNAILHPISRSKWKEAWRDADRAIHIYLDTERNPTHLELYDEALAKARTALADPMTSPEDVTKAKNIIAQEKTVRLSQNLSPEQKAIAGRIADEYKTIGELAKDNEIIRETLDNYVARAWDFGAHSTEQNQRFATSTRHSMKRTLDTILEGFAKGYKLKIEGASNNLATLHREISNVIENKRLLDQGLALKDSNGVPLFTTESGLDGYARIETPNFKKWKYEGKISDYNADERRVFGRDTMITSNGTVMRKRDVYAPKDIATSLNNIFGKTKLDGSLVQGFTKFNAAVKQSILSYSGFHFAQFTYRHIYVVPEATKVKAVNPISAYKTGLNLIASENPLLMSVIKNGMTLSRKQDFTEGVTRHNTWLGEKIDKMGGFPAAAKDAILNVNAQFHKSLFDSYGAGLKAFDAISMMKHEISRNTGETEDQIAARVGKLMNDTYGGLNWNRMRGSALQNPTVRHISSLLFLAPDWTVSNLRLFKNAFNRGEEGLMYRKMWAKVILRGIMLTTFVNAAMAAWDDEDEDGNKLSWVDAMARRYKKGWDAGHLRWLMVDLTPIYHAAGGDLDKRSYLNIFGAYSDPLKMMGVSKSKDGGIQFGLQDFMEAKSSFTTKLALESFTGENWQHKQFTTLDEMLGMDDKGVYKYDQNAHKRGEINPNTGKPYVKHMHGHLAGEAKGGKHKGDLTRNPDYGGGVSIWKHPATIPSFIGSQMRGMLPTSLQSLAAASTGENDWAQFAMQAPGTGVVTSKDPDAK